MFIYKAVFGEKDKKKTPEEIIKELHEDFAAYTAQIDRLKVDLSNQTTELSEVTRKYAELQTSHKNLKEQHAKETSNLHLQIDEAMSYAAAELQEVSHAQEDMTTLSAKNLKLEEKIKGLEEVNSQLQDRIVEKDGVINDCNARMKEMQVELVERDIQWESLSVEVLSFLQEMASLEIQNKPAVVDTKRRKEDVYSILMQRVRGDVRKLLAYTVADEELLMQRDEILPAARIDEAIEEDEAAPSSSNDMVTDREGSDVILQQVPAAVVTAPVAVAAEERKNVAEQVKPVSTTAPVPKEEVIIESKILQNLETLKQENDRLRLQNRSNNTNTSSSPTKKGASNTHFVTVASEVANKQVASVGTASGNIVAAEPPLAVSPTKKTKAVTAVAPPQAVILDTATQTIEGVGTQYSAPPVAASGSGSYISAESVDNIALDYKRFRDEVNKLLLFKEQKLQRQQDQVDNLVHKIGILEEKNGTLEKLSSELKIDLATKETKVRAECSRDMIRLASEVEHLKSMVAWKSKIAEDDAMFRADAAWREKTKALISEIEHLRAITNQIDIEKHAADLTLLETASLLNERNTELIKNKQVNLRLSNSIMSLGHIKDAAERLRREVDCQWKDDLTHKHSDAIGHLRKEQTHFKYLLSDREEEEVLVTGDGNNNSNIGAGLSLPPISPSYISFPPLQPSGNSNNNNITELQNSVTTAGTGNAGIGTGSKNKGISKNGYSSQFINKKKKLRN